MRVLSMPFYFYSVLLLPILIASASDFFQSFGGSPFGNAPNTRPSDNEFYKRLGVDSSATADQIKSAYRKQAMKTHPDKGGDAEQFKKLSEAYEVLSDAKKRSMYDKYGKDGLSQGGQGSANFGGFNDIFRGFGGFSGFSMPIMMQLDLSLEDLYKGKEISMSARGNANIKIKIEPGMFGGQQLMSRGQIVDSKGTPRDVIFRINEIRHSIFQRKNADLLMDLKISLREALLGFERMVKHLDGKDFWIRARKGEITAGNDVLVLRDMGMPVFGQPLVRGRLFVKIRVEFPKKMWLEGPQLQMLESLLPPNLSGANYRKRRADEPVVHATPSDLSSFGRVGAEFEEEGEEAADNPFAQFFFR